MPTVLVVIAVVIFLFSFFPTINFYTKLFRARSFTRLSILAGFIIFHTVCGASIFVIAYSYWINAKPFTTFLPLFFLMQLLFYTLLVAIFMLFYLILLLNRLEPIIKKITSYITVSHRHKKVFKILDKLRSTYYDDGSTSPLSNLLLSNNFIRTYLTVSYLLSAVIVASDLANDFLLYFISHSSGKANLDTFKSVYNQDLQLYINIAIISTVPILLTYFFSKESKDKCK